MSVLKWENNVCNQKLSYQLNWSIQDSKIFFVCVSRSFHRAKIKKRRYQSIYKYHICQVHHLEIAFYIRPAVCFLIMTILICHHCPIFQKCNSNPKCFCCIQIGPKQCQSKQMSSVMYTSPANIPLDCLHPFAQSTHEPWMTSLSLSRSLCMEKKQNSC